MKLNKHIFTEKEKLSEFDRWITPSLGDIKDSIEFSKTREIHLFNSKASVSALDIS